MKFRGAIFFSLIAVVLTVAAYYPKVNTQEKESVLVRTILRGLEQLHYQPQKIDDSFSEKVYDLYLEQLDSGKRFLTQEDINSLEKFKYNIDDESNAGTYEFFDLSLQLVEAGMEKTQAFYRDMLNHPFDFSQKEGIEMDGKKRLFAKNDKELKEFWQKYLKYEVLTRYADKLEEQKDVGEEGEQKSEEMLEAEAREEVLEMFENWYERLGKLKREDRLSYYLNTLTSIFDPHTNYFKPIDKENFNIRFSGRLEGIGARLMNDGDYTKVSDIVVGGPAWKTKELEANDVIMKVSQENEEAVDIKNMVLDDVVSQIRGDKGTKVTLTVKKVDGTVKDISIVRDIVIIDERFAKSLILDGATEDEKIGYIYLPSFYADFENEDGRNCSDDVKNEIEKLKARNVDGIILDLRNNGGGSLRDVVDMSGYFIEKGPIVQVKSRRTKPEVLMDTDPSVQYDGPVVVMVNSYSASASEILAAALQDYGRAIIVGSKSTFGKGTVQRFVDLDRTIRGFEEVKPLGEVKLTMQKFYRIDGGSTQLKGVIPDIILPDNYHYINTGEKEEQFPMGWSEISPVEYSQKVVKIKNLDKIRINSENRLKNNSTFQKVLENAKRLQTKRDESIYPLSLAEYQTMEIEHKHEAEAFKGMFDEVVLPGVTNLDVDLPSIYADESKKARNEDWIGSVSKDVYVKETVNIMHDLINQ